MVRARTAIAGYEVEMVPVVVHHRIAHVHCFHRWTHLQPNSYNGLARPEPNLSPYSAGYRTKGTITQWPDLILNPRSSAPDAPPLPLLRGPREPARRAC